jgi:superfamily I DNA and/or RNA helicase
MNREEANAIASVLKSIDKPPLDVYKSVIIITFYARQVCAIKSALRAKGLRARVATVDSFQGSEADIVIISFCRSNLGNHVGFLACENRLNVALTRAKHSLLLFGHAKTLAGCKSVPIRSLITLLRENDNVVKLQANNLQVHKSTQSQGRVTHGKTRIDSGDHSSDVRFFPGAIDFQMRKANKRQKRER